MRVLVIYFSYSGNNRLLANDLAERIRCDICPVVEKKRRTMLTIFLDMMFRRTPRIEPIECTPAEYDHVILVAPVWGSKLANPMKALIEREKGTISSYSFITLCGYGRAGQLDDLASELVGLVGHPAEKVCELKVGDLLPVERRNEIRTISRYRVTRQDLQRFEPDIEAFCEAIHVKSIGKRP